MFKNTEKMHAELKIISILRNKLEIKSSYENYIGCSKLCCLDCHCFIYGINYAKGYNNKLEISNWNPPFNINGISGKLNALKESSIGKNTKKQAFQINSLQQ